MSELTPQQAIFVREYLVDLNATQAAIRAGYSAASAASQGSRLLSLDKVSRAVKAAQDARAERTHITQDDVLRELARVAFADPAKCLGPDGKPLALHLIPEEARAALAVYEVEVGDAGATVCRVRRWDKTKTLELIGKHLGMWSEKVELSGEPLQVVVQTLAAPKETP
jgi:phage terminase small subunit